MRICIVYDCVYPFTVGGAERWYGNLAQRLVADGHEVTYLTLRQWPRGEHPASDGVRVVAVGPRMELYSETRRRVAPPVVFGAGVLWHLLRSGSRYDVVHTASFPYFSVLAAALARRMHHFQLVVDWHEVWSAAYWRDYLGPTGGRIGLLVQRLCMTIPQRAFCFSELHAGRLRSGGMHDRLTVLRGEYAGTPMPAAVRQADPLVVFAARLIPEKRALLGLAAVAQAVAEIPGLQAVFYGDGPEHRLVKAAIENDELGGAVIAPGFVAKERVEADLRRALCMLLPSRREGYGLVVVEAAALATPSIVVAGEDNAATELVEDGVNGLVVREADADALADAIVRVYEEGIALRESTAAWFARNARQLSLSSSLERVLDSYRVEGPARTTVSAHHY